MSDYKVIFEEEQHYLEAVTGFLKQQLALDDQALTVQKKNLVALRKEMWAEGVPAADDYDRNIELNQYHTMERMETSQYEQKLAKLEKYKQILDKPYFGRFDFAEEGDGKEKIYIGYQNVMKDDTYEVMVYDWRAPIASMFYRNEVGKASYHAPCGEIRGEVELKRQYEIEKQQLKYYFDCSLTITDELLKQALAGNASSYMKNIVETIQKEQDLAIRDKGNDLLIVQGVAGSGKTSIAMHRIAFLLFERMSEGLTSENIMIISPNRLFGEYVSTVLPQLGEDNVAYSTMEDFFETYFRGSLKMRSRNSQLEHMITSKNRENIRSSVHFKGSREFITILDRLVEAYEGQLICFENVYYGETLIADKNKLRKNFLDNPIQMAVGRRLKRIEQGLLKKLKDVEKLKQRELLKAIQGKGGYRDEEEVIEQLEAYKQATLMAIRRFVKIDCFKLYKNLFQDERLFNRLSADLNLPDYIENIRRFTARSLNSEMVPYEDGMAMLYLKLKLEDEHLYPHIKQVLIDEAQDYYPLQYQILGEIFRGVQYTVLGDIGQTIEKNETEELYEEVINRLKPKRALKLCLNKSYRSSYEISMFTQRLRGNTSTDIAFERYEQLPVIGQHENETQLFEWMEGKISEYQRDGYETVAIICKSQREVNHVYSKLSKSLDIHRIGLEEEGFYKGVVIMPIYMAKGLEYDAVIVYEVNKTAYQEDEDKQLLYIACTRALHRLALCHTGEMSPFLKEQYTS